MPFKAHKETGKTYGCRWGKQKGRPRPFSSINCGCNPLYWAYTKKNEAFRKRIKKTWKTNAVYIEFELWISELESQKPKGKPKISILPADLQVVSITRSHAMDIVDLFWQIGGFFGLFIGASLMTIL